MGTVLGAALLSAVLASGGTVVALNATGALDRPAPTTTTPTGTTVGANNQPVTIDESSATIQVAAKASPAVVRITVNGSVDTSQGIIPETGVGLGRHLRLRRLDPDQPPRRRGQRHAVGRAQ